jgi:hypothetical protein
MNGSVGRKLMLAMCASSDGYLIGRDDAIRARSTLDMGRFLGRVLAPPAGARGSAG